ncbi:putative bifunctional diguanylate cyclase/phosphodiesterase [Pseudomaricurvus sp.]|uniref:putative bifunctional diguanylate cyclase/phosphodiesterase n=1 Tax=Pseudomaricurvus sp. TaxID=2004510 RepID=UPI003F6A5DFE
MIRISYLTKVLCLLLALVLLVELSSYMATRLVVRDTVTSDARQELQRGGHVFAELIRGRAEQLTQSAKVLTNDFGFKAAVAVADKGTLESALRNHGARINADVALVTDQSGNLVASTLPLSEQSWSYLSGHIQGYNDADRHFLLMLNQRLYQFVVSDVRAPLPIGTAGLGFEIDDQMTENLKRLTGLDIAFVNLGSPEVASPRVGEARYLSGTLTHEAKTQLLSWLDSDQPSPNQVITTAHNMILVLPLAEHPIPLAAVLQVPLAQVMSPFTVLNQQLLWVAVGFSLLAGLLALLLARSVTRPVRALASVARRIARGSYDAPVAVHSRDELGELAQGFTLMQGAIAEREQQILHQAHHDQLTGLMNRSQLFSTLSDAIQTASHADKHFALVVLDIHHFTRINDALSPEIGDRVLAEVGRRLAEAARPDEHVVRLGSDEFALLLWLTETDAIPQRTRALLELFSKPVHPEKDITLTVEVNLGLVGCPQDGDQPELLLRRANLALAQGRLSRQRVTRYQDGWDERHLRRLALSGEFRRALLDNQLQVYYQPKLWLNNNIIGAEALVRWQHPQMGMISPDEFITVAENTGQIGLLTRYVLRTAVHSAAKWPVPVHLSVNLSALDLLDDTLPGFLHALLHDNRFAANHLCLEITESAIMQEAERSLHNLEQLRQLGLTLSIDDFGTGYSSLSQLKKLPVEELKIDKSFILNLDANEDDQLIVRSTIELGHTLGLAITAEGVENAAAEARLTAWGCDRVQGFYYSKPLPQQEFLQWLAEHQTREANL